MVTFSRRTAKINAQFPSLSVVVAVQRDRVDGVILLAVAAAQQCSGCGDVQGDVALHFHGADDENSGGNQNRSAVIFGAGVDRGLERGGIEVVPVTLGAVVRML